MWSIFYSAHEGIDPGFAGFVHVKTYILTFRTNQMLAKAHQAQRKIKKKQAKPPSKHSNMQ